MKPVEIDTVAVINSLPGIFYLIDKDGRFLMWNKNLEQVTGFSAHEIHNMKPEDFFKGDDQQHIAESIQRVYKEGSATAEAHIVTRQGARVPFHFTGSLTYVNNQPCLVGMGTDLSAIKNMETALKDIETSYHGLFNSSPLPQWIVDIKTFRFLDVSRAAIQHYGYSRDEFLNISLLDILTEDDRHRILTDKKSFQVTPDSFYSKWKHKKKNGEVIQTEVTSVAVTYKSNPAVLCIVNDVTEKNKLQEQLTASVIKAQERERAQLGQELHDNVNQILTTVKLYNEMYGSGLQNDAELIKKSMHYLQLCIDEIRNISKRLSAPMLGKINIEDSITELIKSINFTHRLKVSYDISGLSGLSINSDLHLTIYRIVQEQLNNILKHSGATEAKIVLKPDKTNNTLRLVIKDNGKGFDQSEKSRGIGISNMKSRAENMKGKLTIETEPGKGCKLEAQFPL